MVLEWVVPDWFLLISLAISDGEEETDAAAA